MAGEITIESLRKKRRERNQADARALEEKATIVAVAQTHSVKGSVTTFRIVDVDGTYIPNMVWIRFYGGADNEVYEALNINGVKPRANLPVIAEQYEPGKYEVTKLRAKEANELLGAAAPHFSGTDDIPELTDPIAAAHTGAGRVRLASESDQLTVFVEPFWYSWNGIRVRWPGGSLDISGELPGTSSYWGWCQIAINPTDNTVTAISGSEVSSYPQLTDDSLDDIDVSGYIPVDAVKLQNGMTSSDGLNRPEYFFAGRITLTGPQATATAQTTDATVTTLVSIAVAELESWRLVGDVIGIRDDYSEMIAGSIAFSARRATSGNVTLVGSANTTIDEDSSGSPTFTGDVDTGTQTMRVRVTGEASKTFNWKINYTLMEH